MCVCVCVSREGWRAPEVPQICCHNPCCSALCYRTIGSEGSTYTCLYSLPSTPSLPLSLGRHVALGGPPLPGCVPRVRNTNSPCRPPTGVSRMPSSPPPPNPFTLSPLECPRSKSNPHGSLQEGETKRNRKGDKGPPCGPPRQGSGHERPPEEDFRPRRRGT